MTQINLSEEMIKTLTDAVRTAIHFKIKYSVGHQGAEDIEKLQDAEQMLQEIQKITRPVNHRDTPNTEGLSSLLP